LSKLTTPKLELIVANYFNERQNLIVPNVYWGWGLDYEADLVIVSTAGYATEIELKISRADLKADAKKKHCHNAPIFRKLYFAMPLEIVDLELIPERAGIFAYGKHTVEKHNHKLGPVIPTYDWTGLEIIRQAKLNKSAPRVTDAERMKLGHLAAMRIWNIKAELKIANEHIETLEAENKLKELNGN